MLPDDFVPISRDFAGLRMAAGTAPAAHEISKIIASIGI
jgi:hypothetical protein